jgi:hypothetical protein
VRFSSLCKNARICFTLLTQKLVHGTPTGTLVWARSGPHPFYPAEVVDPYAEDTPPWLKAEARRPGEVNKIAVMYFDDTRSG